MFVIWERQLNPDGTPDLAANGRFDQQVGNPPQIIRTRIEPRLAEGQYTLWQASISPAYHIRNALTQLAWTMPAPNDTTDTAITTCRTLHEAYDMVSFTADRIQAYLDHPKAFAEPEGELEASAHVAASQMDFLFPVHRKMEAPDPAPGQ